MTLTVQEVMEATGGSLLQGGEGALFERVSTDSRTIQGGDLFIALKGDRFDGHAFVLEVLEKKAGGVMVEEGAAKDLRWDGDRTRVVIVVEDTLKALGDLARQTRRKYRTPVIALTGSNGKTTTKEMISACLATTLPLLKTQGNLNNLIGLPLTLLKLTGKEKVAVLEMGMNVPGEIRRLTEIAEPDVGLITNIQQAHLEGMGSLERLKEEKGELFRRMKQSGTILVNRDDPRIVDLAKDFPGDKITFAMNGPAEVMARDVRLDGSRGTSFPSRFWRRRDGDDPSPSGKTFRAPCARCDRRGKTFRDRVCKDPGGPAGLSALSHANGSPAPRRGEDPDQ